ncbi:metallophosphoesterase family protein [Thermodesulfatator atlanticus]|uniref:metallophosphoesterase family protein n=1 Tax=Thermodesulfatator atlanticus TaxID=501497 RepID=UPI0003B5DB3A|nr:metallophosphoesterase [Thermodesulfatator atlanticus]
MEYVIHFSDLHLSVEAPPPRKLLGRRALGFLRWKLSRGRKHSLEPLMALQKWLAAAQVSQVVITGDLVHLGLPEEFSLAKDFLERLGPPEKIFLVPGNHDFYVPEPFEKTFAKWSPYLHLDESRDYPTVLKKEHYALIGLDTTCPNVPPFAMGELGDKQLARLKDVLKTLREAGLVRILALHHPPLPGMISTLKALKETTELAELLREEGLEIVLFGHTHKIIRGYYETRLGKSLFLGAPSLTYVGNDPLRKSRFFRIGFDNKENSLNINLETYVFRGGAFERESRDNIELAK